MELVKEKYYKRMIYYSTMQLLEFMEKLKEDIQRKNKNQKEMPYYTKLF
jgi:hypothetical protein